MLTRPKIESIEGFIVSVYLSKNGKVVSSFATQPNQTNIRMHYSSDSYSAKFIEVTLNKNLDHKYFKSMEFDSMKIRVTYENSNQAEEFLAAKIKLMHGDVSK
jgi:hypothetical protein